MTGPELAKLRVAARLSISALARLLDVSRPTIHRWEALGPPRRFHDFIMHKLREEFTTRTRPDGSPSP